jgi:hypothetical protein
MKRFVHPIINVRYHNSRTSRKPPVERGMLLLFRRSIISGDEGPEKQKSPKALRLWIA